MSDEQRDQAFLAEYMIDFNGTRAARATGLGGASPAQAAYRILCKQSIKDEVNRLIAERRAQNKITVAHVEGMLRDLAEVEPLDIWDEDGRLRPLQDIPPHARRAIKAIKRTEKEHPITGVLEVKVEIELWDKKGAIELLGKYKKMFTDKVELSGELKTKVSFSVNGVAK